VIVEESLGSVDRDLTSELSKRQAEFDHWHSKIRESAKARQIEQNQLSELKCRASERVELDRRITNLERDSEGLLAALNEVHRDSIDSSDSITIGDADQDSDVDVTKFDSLFPGGFDPSAGFTGNQRAFLTALPPAEFMKSRIKQYQEHNEEILTEVEHLKSKNVVLGKNYRRMVIACTGWTAEQVDEAAEGLTQCVRELNDNPVPEDEAIEILMNDRGQDW
jgi:hypothetical protein